MSCFVSMWRVSDGRDSSTHCGVSAPGPEWDMQEVWAQNRFACISVLGKGVNARDSGFGVSSFPHPRYCLPSPPGLACLSSARPILSCHCTGTGRLFSGTPPAAGLLHLADDALANHLLASLIPTPLENSVSTWPDNCTSLLMSPKLTSA